jgi:uncharacterized repeat protein (TIGR01451 family)
LTLKPAYRLLSWLFKWIATNIVLYLFKPLKTNYFRRLILRIALLAGILALTVLRAHAQFPVVATTATSYSPNEVNSHNISLPAGIQSGDLLLVFWADGGNTPSSSVNIPGGWTFLYNQVNNNYRCIGIYRIADGTEGSTITVTTSIPERSAHNSYRIAALTFIGVPVAATTAFSPVNNNKPNPPTLISGFGTVPTLWLAASHSSGDDNFPPPLPPPSYSSLITAYTGNGSAYPRMATARRELTAPSENPDYFILGSPVAWGANTIAIEACVDAMLTLTSGAGTDNQTTCLYIAITPITYSVGGSATGATVTGLPPGVGGIYNAGVVTISGTPAIAGIYNYSVLTTGTPPPCEEDTVYGTITVLALPTVTWPTTLTNQCVSSTAYTLTGGSPPGGSYSGPGVTGTNFNASVAGAGTHILQYNYTDGNGCTSYANNSITVYALPVVTCPAGFSVCIDTPPVTLTGASPEGGTYSGMGVSSGIFTPAVAGTGTWPITYTYTDTNGCTNSCFFNITVNPLPVVTCPADFVTYINAAPITLTGGNPPGGTYSGAGVVSNIFYPAVAGYGTHIITYTYTNPSTTCTNSCTFNITVTDKLSITKTTTSEPVRPGDPFNYQLTYSNLNSTDAALDVIITDTLPPVELFTYLSSTPSGTYNVINHTLTWSFSSLPPNSSGTIIINGICGQAGTFYGYHPASYYICAGSCTPTATNESLIQNTVTAAIVSSVADPLIQFCGPNLQPDSVTGWLKSSTPSAIYYVFTITNEGNITDKFLLSIIPNVTPPTTEDLGYNIMTLAGDLLTETDWLLPGESLTFLVQVYCLSGTQPNNINVGFLVATSYVCGTYDQSKITTQIYGGQIPGDACDLSLMKIASSNPMTVGSMYDYTLTVTNTLEPAKNVIVRDTLPSSVIYISSSYSTSDPEASVNLVYNAVSHMLSGAYQNPPKNELINGEWFQVTISILTTCVSAPSVENHAVVVTSTVDADETNNEVYLNTVVISNIPSPVVTPPAPIICSGEPDTLTASGAGSGFGYKWYDTPMAGNLLFTGNPYITPILTTTTIYYAAIYDTTDTICESARTAVTVTVIPVPDITLQPVSIDVCEGQDSMFNITATGQSLSYQWQVSTDGGTSYANLSDILPYSGVNTPTLSIVNTPLSLDGYFYRCLVTTVNCDFMVYSDPALLTVYQLPIVTTVNACIEGSPVTFTQTGGIPGGTWTVTGGGTITSGGVFTPNATGCYDATYTTPIPPSPGCSDTKGFVVFPAAPAAPVVNAGCGPIIVTPPISVPGFTVEYSFNDGVTWGGNNPPTAENCDGYLIRTRYVTGNACGAVPAGTVSSNPDCGQSLATSRVVDLTIPEIICPESMVIDADSGMTYATVSLPAPVYSDNCTAFDSIGLSWEMSGATIASGIGIIPDPHLFNVGTTTINYTVTDECTNSNSCQFTVTVEPNDPPEITCPPDVTGYPADTSECFATLTEVQIGTPLVVPSEGSVISWERSDGELFLTAPFPVGTTIITWIATNVSGADTCFQVIIVTDAEPPVFTAPEPAEFCVQSILTAQWDGQPEPDADITPERPDWYIMPAGSEELDLINFVDNCCDSVEMTVAWTINFSDSHPDIIGVGQPSEYDPDNNGFPDPILFWGTTDYTVIVHTITYVLADCNGNLSDPVPVNIMINPRPNVIKEY